MVTWPHSNRTWEASRIFTGPGGLPFLPIMNHDYEHMAGLSWICKQCGGIVPVSSDRPTNQDKVFIKIGRHGYFQTVDCQEAIELSVVWMVDGE